MKSEFDIFRLGRRDIYPRDLQSFDFHLLFGSRALFRPLLFLRRMTHTMMYSALLGWVFAPELLPWP
jgi:hypothetical protein